MIAGALELQLFADVARIKSDMDKAQSIIGGAMGAIEKQAAALKTVLGGVATGLSVGAVAGFINGAIQAAAKLHDLSIQAGMSVEALSGLAAVGKSTSTGADMISAASNKLSKSLATSNEESKGAAAAVKALGLNYDALQKMSPDERMRAIAVAMNQFKDGGQKSAAAMLLFGKAGAELLPFLKDLATAGELHAKVTEQQAEAAHQFEVNLGRLKTASEAWKKQLAMELLPTLNDVVDALLALKSAGKGDDTSFIGQVLITALQTVAVLGLNVLYVFKQTYLEIKGIGEQLWAIAHLDWDKFNSIGDAMKRQAYEARVEVDKLSNSILGITNSRAGAGRGSVNPPLLGPIPAKQELTGLAGDPNAENTKKYDALIRSIKERIAVDDLEMRYGRQLTEGEKFQIKTLTELNDATLKFTEAQKAAARAELARLAVKDLALQMQKQDLKLAGDLAKEVFKEDAELAADDAMRNAARGKAAWATYEETRALKDYGEQLAAERMLLGATDAQRSIALENLRVEIKLRNDLEALDREPGLNDEARAKRRAGLIGNAATAKEFNEFKAQTDEMAKFWGNAFKGMEDALVNFVKTGKLNFGSLVDSAISDLVRLEVQQDITKPLWSMVTGSSFLSSLGLSGTKAIGGAVNAGSSYLVGERGPEIFTAPSSGRIAANDQIGRASAPTIVINNQIGSVASQSDVVQGMQRVRAQIVGELSRSRAYGGTA